MKRLLFLSIFALILMFVGITKVEAITIANYDFEDNAFADTLTSYSNLSNLFGGAPDFETSLTDIDPATGVSLGIVSPYTAGSVQMEFTDNYIINEDDYDIALFEVGYSTIESFSVDVTLSGNTIEYSVTNTGYNVQVGSTFYPLRIALIDISDFGIAPGVLLSSIEINAGPNTITPPELSLVGALNSVPIPEPATMLLLSSGLIGIVGFKRKLAERS